MSTLFDSQHWVGNSYDKEIVDGANLDVQLLREKAMALLKQEEQEGRSQDLPLQQLRRVAQRLRYQIATKEPIASSERRNLRVMTLWGAKGMTAEHVYILGTCREALPGERRPEYPGTPAEYFDEQRRLFYVSITRTKKTLVISRALCVRRNLAKRLGLAVRTRSNSEMSLRNRFSADLEMSPFLRDIMGVLPAAVRGASWAGCVTG